MEYTTGITTKVSKVDTSNPPITVIPIGARNSAPSPNPIAKEVILKWWLG